nr:hypothetical protein Iba_chr03cCG4620 [Ipomoea batatas]
MALACVKTAIVSLKQCAFYMGSVCVNGFSMCKNPDCDMVAVCIFLRQCVHLAWVVIAFVKLGVRKILRLVCGCVGDVGLVMHAAVGVSRGDTPEFANTEE